MSRDPAGDPNAVPPRLVVVLASDAPVGVVFRRGPSKRVRLIRWDVSADRFEPGQWLNGVAEPDDLSPDGELLLYTASTHRPGVEHQFFTALSRPPYFTALALWPYSHGWHSGGLFTGRRTLRRGYWEAHVPPDTNVKPRPAAGRLRVEAVAGHLRADRQERAGWLPLRTDLPRRDVTDVLGLRLGPHARLYRKFAPSGRASLVRAEGVARTGERFGPAGGGRYELTAAAGAITPMPRVEWADFDRRGRLVYARDGKLWASDPSADPTAGEGVAGRELADFNGDAFEPVAPPAWALEWPASEQASN